ncbi:hypothetical protein HMPREF9120_00843 [Neisseria sp. oral taxon 020 str. F0370]|nr:hypothetical protein HMPREF9120_00843 [Neisseria sp. oral taxon 020 str. F0370]
MFARAITVGTVFEPDYEALNAYRPQLVITGGPSAEAYPKLAGIAPTVDLTVDNANIRESGGQQMDALARIFGREAQAAKLKAEIDALFAQTRTAAKGQGRCLVLSIPCWPPRCCRFTRRPIPLRRAIAPSWKPLP